jgi:aspartyl-tRNA(Asn)/glutamyl-tRNA(Gln) amidotransferase subunit A
VRKVAAPDPWATLFEMQVRAMQYEASRIYRPLLDKGLGPKLREMIALGLGHADATYRDDCARLAAARARLWPVVADAAAVLFPAAPATAPAGLASTGDPRYISPWTALGGPIVTQPLGIHPNGMPYGMLVCGAPGTDRALARTAIDLAAAYTRATKA